MDVHLLHGYCVDINDSLVHGKNMVMVVALGLPVCVLWVSYPHTITITHTMMVVNFTLAKLKFPLKSGLTSSSFPGIRMLQPTSTVYITTAHIILGPPGIMHA